MPAILVQKGTKYTCNFSFDRDHICLQSRKFSKHLESDRLGSKSYLKNRDCRHIWSLSKLKLQAYLVPNVIKIVPIFDPCCNQNCKHNRPPPLYKKYMMINYGKLYDELGTISAKYLHPCFRIFLRRSKISAIDFSNFFELSLFMTRNFGCIVFG